VILKYINRNDGKKYEEEWNATYWKWQARREPKEQA